MPNLTKTLLAVIVMAGVMTGCANEDPIVNPSITVLMGDRGGVEQSLHDGCPIGETLNEKCIITAVFLKSKIYWHSYLPVTTDSTVIKHHLDSAVVIYKNIIKLK